MRICLDPGHGGGDPGAIGPTKVCESRVVLKVAFALRTILEQVGHDVIMTRASDKNVELKARSDFGNLCDLFLSIHCNAVDNAAVSGVETIYSCVNAKSSLFADCIQNSIMRDHEIHLDRRTKKSPSAEYARNLYVLNNVKVPSALVELEFISNPKWEKYLLDNSIAYSVLLSNGINNYIKSSLP